MASLITHGLTFSKEDAQKFFLQPLFLSPEVMDHFDVMTDVSSSFKLQKYSSKEKISKAEAAGFSGSTGVTLTQRSVTVARVEAEAGQSGRDFFNSIEAERLRRGIDKDDITGTALQEIFSAIMLKGIRRDWRRQLWLSDTALGDADYNIYDGIFKNFTGLPAAQQLTIAAGALAADAAESTFQTMKDAAPAEMFEDMSNLRIYCTRGMAENYRQTLKTLGVSEGYNALVGGVPELRWDGIPVIEMADWDVHLEADKAALGITDINRAVLMNSKNVVVGTDLDSNVGLETWYNRDEKEYRTRFQYLMGTNYKNDELAVVAKQA